MGLTLDTSIPVFTVFLQGLLSFFSPCVLPLIPVYISYFSGGASTVDENGNILYPRTKIFINTVFFVIGISLTFFLLGFSFTAFARFLNSHQRTFAVISGMIMILFGIYQFGFFGKVDGLEKERRLPFHMGTLGMNPIAALILGFTFSFAWTPCIGPVMSGVLLMASSSATYTKAFLLIGVYILGFIMPFLSVGIFTGSVLNFFKKNQNIVKYTVKVGAVLLIIMGLMTVSGFMNGLNRYLLNISNSKTATVNTSVSNNESIRASETTKDTKADNREDIDKEDGEGSENPETSSSSETSSQKDDTKVIPAPDFTLTDQFGKTHKLSEYKGKTVFLNFWATWCPPCRAEMPHIQSLYEKYGKNSADLIILGVAGPNLGNETNKEGIISFLEENEYSFPVAMDESGLVFNNYAIRSFPTTFMIDDEGTIYGYVSGSLSEEYMENIIQQTMEKAPR